MVTNECQARSGRGVSSLLFSYQHPVVAEGGRAAVVREEGGHQPPLAHRLPARAVLAAHRVTLHSHTYNKQSQSLKSSAWHALTSKKTGRSKPSLTPSMWMVSLEMVMPFQPRRMAPLGLLSGRFRPRLITCAADGVTWSRGKINLKGRFKVNRNIGGKINCFDSDRGLLEDRAQPLASIHCILQHLSWTHIHTYIHTYMHTYIHAT